MKLKGMVAATRLKYGLLLGSLLVSAALSCCQGGANTIKPSLDNEFSLGIGQVAELQGEHLTIQFEGIQEDSRCPKGAMCIWQGRVRSLIQINGNGPAAGLSLTEPGLSSARGKDTYKRYEFTSHVEPYPEVGKQISSKDYRLFLVIRKMPAGTN
jgi:hypothetical protein